MKWLTIGDYFDIIPKMIILYLFEILCFQNIFISIILLIINILLTIFILHIMNKNYEKRLKRIAKETKFIEDEYNKLN